MERNCITVFYRKGQGLKLNQKLQVQGDCIGHHKHKFAVTVACYAEEILTVSGMKEVG